MQIKVKFRTVDGRVTVVETKFIQLNSIKNDSTHSRRQYMAAVVNPDTGDAEIATIEEYAPLGRSEEETIYFLKNTEWYVLDPIRGSYVS